MIEQKLKNFIQKKKCTLLGVGPMSVNCVDAAVELANDYEVPTFLIASRRQIDSEEFGGGYVNNWTTSEFAQYVTNKDKKGKCAVRIDYMSSGITKSLVLGENYKILPTNDIITELNNLDCVEKVELIYSSM